MVVMWVTLVSGPKGPPAGRDTKRKRSGVKGQTMEGKQAKTGALGQVEATKYWKPAFNWSQVTLVVLKKDGQPMSLVEYDEVKGNLVLKEIDLAEKDGTLIDIELVPRSGRGQIC